MTTVEKSEWVHVWRGRKKHIPAAGNARRTMCGKPWLAWWIEGAPETERTPECRQCLVKAGREGLSE